MCLSIYKVRRVVGSVPCQRAFANRNFSVKELSWCAPKNSVSHRAAAIAKTTDDGEHKASDHKPINRFGIIAAVSACKNRVIGKDGVIPWPRISEDRKLFKELTRQSILVIGRKTLEECRILGEGKYLVHVNHTKHCIVISKTLDNLDEYELEKDQCDIRLVRSFPEALALARQLVDKENKQGDEFGTINCWIGGGERIFEESLRHPSAAELHLSHVHVDIELTRGTSFSQFPAKYRWDHRFKEVSQTDYPATSSSPSFTYTIYRPQ